MVKIAILYIMIILSAATYGFEKIGSYYGDNPENLIKPVSLDFDKQGNLYVLDYTGGKIVIFDNNFKYIESIGGFNSPSSISIWENKIFVTETLYDRVIIYDMLTKKRKNFGNKGMREGEFNHPGKVCFYNNKIIIPDDYNFRIQIFDSNMKYDSEIILPKYGYLHEASYSNNYILFNNNGIMNIYDKKNKKNYLYNLNKKLTEDKKEYGEVNDFFVHKNKLFWFDLKKGFFFAKNKKDEEIKTDIKNEFSIIQFWKGAYREGAYYYFSGKKLYSFNPETRKNSFIKNMSVKKENEFIEPADIKRDSNGNIYVLDKVSGYIMKYDRKGKFQSNFINCGFYPTSFFFDKFDNIYVAVAGERCIKKYSITGSLISTFGNFSSNLKGIKKVEEANEQSEINYLGITMDSEGYIYVADAKAYKVYIYDQSFYLKNQFGKKASIVSVVKGKKEAGTFGWDEKSSYGINDIAVYDGKSYIIDGYYNRINIFNKNGFISYFEDSFSEKGVTSICIKDKKIYVTDTLNFNIKVYDLNLKKIKDISFLKDGLMPYKISGNMVLCRKVASNYKERYVIILLKENEL